MATSEGEGGGSAYPWLGNNRILIKFIFSSGSSCIANQPLLRDDVHQKPTLKYEDKRPGCMCIYCLPLEEEEEKLLILRENGNSRKSSQMENELRDVNTLIRDGIHPKVMLSKQDKRLRLAEKEELPILRKNADSRKSS